MESPLCRWSWDRRLRCSARATCGLAALVVAALSGACARRTPARTALPADQFTELTDRHDVQVTSSSGLQQRVILLTPGVRRGSHLRLRSVLKNTSDGPLEISARICGFDVSTDLSLDRSLVSDCRGYSVLGTLSSGSSLAEVWDGGKVDSPPGRYRVRVRHVLEPELWTEAWITVRP